MFLGLNNNVNKDEVSIEDLKQFFDTIVSKKELETLEIAAKKDIDAKATLQKLLSLPSVHRLLIIISRSNVFDGELASTFATSKETVRQLRCVKLLKYCYNIPCGQLCNLLAILTCCINEESNDGADTAGEKVVQILKKIAVRVLDSDLCGKLAKDIMIGSMASKEMKDLYEQNSKVLLEYDPHALYPTSIYRTCQGHVTSSSDSSVIESVMGTSVTTSIEIVRDVLNPQQTQLRDIYRPLGRCITVIDKRVHKFYGTALKEYFEANGVKLEMLTYRAMEVDKDISTVEKILVDLKRLRVSRNEPVLIVGGGVMADVGGFACALYHRNTPYVMLSTSIVSGIDAGPSPRTCCDGLGYKNVFGAYHPPILSLTDRSFFKTLHPGWIRHGLAEIVKMAVTKNASLFELLEQAGARLVDTKMGVENCDKGSEIDQKSESIIAKAMDAYVRSEYGNLWETHQCRPHAYGHTWSPGFEIQAGLLHGHAVAIGMGYGAYLSYVEKWISEEDLHRVLKLISTLGLSLWHDVLENADLVWASQVKITEKRGGNLCAPVPKGGLGKCGYINDLSRGRLEKTIAEYKEICASYQRQGRGIDPLCRNVGLEDPSTVKQHLDHSVSNGTSTNGIAANGIANGIANGKANGSASPMSLEVSNGCGDYEQWIAKYQVERNESQKTSSSVCANISESAPENTPHPPNFEHETLFHNDVEEYAMGMTTMSSPDFVNVAKLTKDNDMFLPCMVGQIEGQFLKMVARIKGAQRILDIGTFTGYSALAFAGGMGPDGRVVTVENDRDIARVAADVFSTSKHNDNIELVVGDARKLIKKMANDGELFDIVFLDADKVNYWMYYEAGLKMLNKGGLLMADNALCSLVYANDDPARQKLHEFNQKVRSDTRVEQVMLTVREGVLMVQKVE